MRFSLVTFVRELARKEGIPEELLPAVEHRAEMTARAVAHYGRVTPLRDEGRGGILVVGSLDGIEAELETAEHVLGRRVVARAVADYKAGVLERRV